MENFIYNGVNYQDLVKVTVKGLECYASLSDITYRHPHPDIVVSEERPTEFNELLTVYVHNGHRSGTAFHVVDSMEAMPLAKMLAECLDREVSISSFARNLAIFKPGGELMKELKTLDDFYTEITDEERELTRLV